MKNSLNITIDSTLIKKAKKHAKAQKCSLSSLIEEKIKQITNSVPSEEIQRIFNNFHELYLKQEPTNQQIKKWLDERADSRSK